MSQGNTEDAEILLNQVAKARPENFNAQIFPAKTLVRNKKDAFAVETLRNALKVNTENNELNMELVGIHLVQKEPEQARAGSSLNR